MARKRKEQDIPGEVGAQVLEEHGVWRRNTGEPRKMGPPLGNLNAMRHGIYANRFLSEDEKPLFASIIAQLYQDFVFNKSSDFMQVELVGIYFLKMGRAQEAGDWETAERLDRMIRCHLKDLKATKIAREGEQPKAPETTPAEWAAELVNRLKQGNEKAPAKSKPSTAKEENGDGPEEATDGRSSR